MQKSQFVETVKKSLSPWTWNSEMRDEIVDLAWLYKWIRRLAWTVGFISLMAITYLSFETHAHAQDDFEDEEDDFFDAEPPPPTTEPPKGFEPGSRTFNNPFADGQNRGTPPPTQQPISPPGGRPPGFPPPSIGTTRPQPSGQKISINKPGAPRAQDDVPDPKQTPQGVSVGGEPPGGVVASQDSPMAFDINDETGGGNKAIITDFNFPDADVLDIAKTLGKLTGKNFVYDKNVKGRVTIVSNSPITVGDAWRAFLTALDINGFALVPSGSFIRITRQRDARDKQLSTYTGDYSPNTDALITRVFPLKYISADEVARTFRSFMPANARIIPYQQTNTVIVTDTGSNISKLAKMLEFLDVEGFDAGIEVINVKYASAVELSKLIDQLLPGTSAGTGQPGSPRSRTGARGSFEARKTKQGGLINTIIADERTNTLIVHANAKGADEVRTLVKRLDTEVPASAGGGKIHVIYLKYADAEELSKVLSGFSSQAGGSSGSRRSSTGAGGATTGSNPLTNDSNIFEGSVKVAADKATNSLVVTAAPGDFVTVQRVVAKLDVARDQVYVEAIIMEMLLNDNFNFSGNFGALTPFGYVGSQPNNSNLADWAINKNPLAQAGAILGLATGREETIKVNGNEIKVSTIAGLVNALKTYAQANVLATPQIMTMDNQEATFESGERIPLPTSNTGSNGITSQSITYEKIGLTLKITPQINKTSDIVKLDIDAGLEDISGRSPPSGLQDKAFATVTRKAKTNVLVADSDTVVIGGLVRDKTEEKERKVPLLGDIPLLGWLFKSRDTETSKSNLLIFLTPHIVRKSEMARAILDRKLYQRDSFIEKNAGGDDEHRSYRDDIIKGLPSIEELRQKEVSSLHSAAKNDSDSAGSTGSGGQTYGSGSTPGEADDDSDVLPPPASDNIEGNPFAPPQPPGNLPPDDVPAVPGSPDLGEP